MELLFTKDSKKQITARQFLASKLNIPYKDLLGKSKTIDLSFNTIEQTYEMITINGKYYLLIDTCEKSSREELYEGSLSDIEEFMMVKLVQLFHDLGDCKK